MPESIIDCSALGGIRHILRIRAGGRTADDLSLPGREGEAKVTDGEYRLRFSAEPKGFHLLFRINRYTGEGYRQLTDSDDHLVTGHGGDDPIQCAPYAGKRL